MPTVDIMVNGRHHQVQCDPGEEARVRRLAAYIDRRVSELVQTHGQIGDGRLLMMASLLVADELSDAYDEIQRLQKGTGDGAEQVEQEAAQAMEGVAERIEAIARRLEGA